LPARSAPNQVLHDAVELPSAGNVGTRHAERPHDAFEQRSKRLHVGRIEDRHPGDELGGGGVRHQIVGDPDAVDEPAFRKTTLVETGSQLEGRHRDAAAHRLPVDDRPARLPDLLQEQLTERDEVLDEEVWLIFTRAITGCDPRVPFGEDVARDRQHAEIAPAWTALNAVREDHESAAPVLRDLDHVVGAAELTVPSDRRALRRRGRRLGPRSLRQDQRDDASDQTDERAS
jgi:hypothetical protein